MNVHRQLAQDYALLAEEACWAVQWLRRRIMYRHEEKSSRAVILQYIKNLREYMAKVIAYAEQVEHHLEEAFWEEEGDEPYGLGHGCCDENGN